MSDKINKRIDEINKQIVEDLEERMSKMSIEEHNANDAWIAKNHPQIMILFMNMWKSMQS